MSLLISYVSAYSRIRLRVDRLERRTCLPMITGQPQATENSECSPFVPESFMWTMLSRSVAVMLVTTPITLAAISLGDACSTDHDHLDASTGKFASDCDDTAFCSGSTNATCQPRACRRDEFPFGFENATAIPPLCKDGMYCPDEGSGCKALLDVGQPCQSDRDEQCAPPPNWQDLASSWNANGSVCLKSSCMSALPYSDIRDDMLTATLQVCEHDFGSTMLAGRCHVPGWTPQQHNHAAQLSDTPVLLSCRIWCLRSNQGHWASLRVERRVSIGSHRFKFLSTCR